MNKGNCTKCGKKIGHAKALVVYNPINLLIPGAPDEIKHPSRWKHVKCWEAEMAQIKQAKKKDLRSL